MKTRISLFKVVCVFFYIMALAGLRTERPKQRTTRYAGARQKLYKKILQSSTIRLFKS